MKNIHFIITIIVSSFTLISFSQKTKTDANIIGHVVCCGKHLPFATIGLKGTTIGTVTDETGHYQLVNLPTGEQTIFVSILGYKPKEQTVILEAGKTTEVKFELQQDVLNIDEVIVSADRAEQKRTDAPVIVNTISPKLFNTTQSATLGEGLNFSPGLRLENNCQNCGFSQVRMNGMEGPYSQILINSRPIFSGLAGVYGLELIPSNMIEKVEIVRGGGSALYGSNAIAGTINIILKDPKLNSYEGGANYALTGIGMDGSEAMVPDYSVNFNTSIVSDDHKSGISLYGFTRDREMFDANNDGFSEIAPLENLTFGARLFHRFGYRDKLSVDFFTINEERNGGNKQEYPLHERDVAEAVEHNMKVAGITYERYFRQYNLLTVYASGQFLDRDSYYGAGKSLGDYGKSTDNTYNLGIQYKTLLNTSSFIIGIEHTGDFLLDKKLGFPDLENAEIDFSDSTIHYTHTNNTIVSDQSLITSGIFAQYDIRLNKFKFAAGARFDHYKVNNLADEGVLSSGNVFSPRLSFMYNILPELQARLCYSQGYRAPQIFDEDLHILTSRSRQVIHKNATDLKQETSHSIMASIDFNKLIGKVYAGFLLEGFYTRLVNAFSDSAEFTDGIYTKYRINAEDGAIVQGINMELKLKPRKELNITSGFTVQKSAYESPQEEFPEKRFFRTPNQYGYVVLDYDIYQNLCFSATGTYTGSMLIPYFGTENPAGELRESKSFFDLGTKLTYRIKLNGASVEFSGGIKNIFNAYQDDFDVSENRDPAYIYGPVSPRTVYFGIKIGNMLNYKTVVVRENDDEPVMHRGRRHRMKGRHMNRPF
ncbi:MAG: TonB-dependent receptor [Bacteroidales bacterium]|nr:TonB-dependent receptor [Bacteroidales bacterium]